MSADQEGFQGPLVGKKDMRKDSPLQMIILLISVYECVERKGTTIINSVEKLSAVMDWIE